MLLILTLHLLKHWFLPPSPRSPYPQLQPILQRLYPSQRPHASKASRTSPAPEPQDVFKRFGILNENGTMADEFEVGDFEEGKPEEAKNVSLVAKNFELAPMVAVSKFECARAT
ncbi:hypothetical protein VNO80_19418 [Phaseolus coccineus]|uniref:Uncharacterized protein n=1 Tax=Phaseolus coccineus TaxID=3886 RepID=A0AAN9ML58_PHACN